MPLIRWLSVVMFSFLLAACGGGGSIEKDGGSLDDSTDSATYTLTVSGVSETTGEAANEVSSEQRLQLTAKLLKDGAAVSDVRVTFSTDGEYGVFEPTSGTAITDDDGSAKILLAVGSNAGAGTVDAFVTIEGETISSAQSFAFTSTGDADGTVQDNYTITVQGYTQDTGTASNTVTNAAPLDLRATLKYNDSVVAGKRIVFSLTDSIGLLQPTTGSALTQNDGVATVQLTAGKDAGAGMVTATYSIDGDSYTGTFDFQSTGGQGTDTGVSGTITLDLNILDQSGAVFSELNPVSKDNKGIVTATLKDDGLPLASQLISFTSKYTGKITPELGTALTDVNGVATVTLSSGNFKGAGQIIASYGSESDEVITKTAGFVSNGDDAPIENAQAELDIKLLQGCNANWDANRNSEALNPLDPSTGCAVTNTFSSDVLIDVLIKVVDTSSGDGIAGIIAELSTDLGQLLPDSGKALTDNFGFALLKLQPGASSGAGTLTATAKDSSLNKAFSISTAELNVSIDNGLPNLLDGSGNPVEGQYQPLAAGATTVITVEIRDNNDDLIVTPFDVQFTSSCVESGKSIIDENVISIGGIATSTYRTNGCKSTQGDTVIATVLTGGTPEIASVNIPVSEADVASIEFISAEPNVIALKGTGGIGRQENSELKFKLIDKIGQDVKNKRLDFRLTSTNGGISLSHHSVDTDADGFARVQVNSGFVPMAVRVQACFIPDEQIPADQSDDVTCWQDVYAECQKAEGDREEGVSCPTGNLSLVSLDQQIISVSDLLSISTGLPDNNSFTASITDFSTETLQYDNETFDITVLIADHFNNPVPDGTAVYLTTEGGAIGTLDGEEGNPQLECRSIDGACTVQWRSQNPRPFTESKWGNKVSDYNPKKLLRVKAKYLEDIEGIVDPTFEQSNAVSLTQLNSDANFSGLLEETRNCDLYRNAPAPCLNGILNANSHEFGVPLGARATVLVTAKGQESFIDINGNGLFDSNEYYSGYDLSEAFVDHNESGTYDGLSAIYDPVTASIVKDAQLCTDGSDTDPCSEFATNGAHFEEPIGDIDSNGMHTLRDGKYNGLLCTEAAQAANMCNKELIDVRRSFEVIMSGSTVYYRFAIDKESLRRKFAAAMAEPELDADGNLTGNLSANALGVTNSISTCSDILNQYDNSSIVVLGLEESEDDQLCDITEVNIKTYDSGVELDALSFNFYYSDIYNNPLAANTSVVVGSENGDYSGVDDFVIGNSTATNAAVIGLAISREAEPNKKSVGDLSISFTTPKDNNTTARLQISDDG
ncbi:MULTISPECIES: hypothetical protein [unclassified Pseudoalteromonas]|nr:MULTISPECIES: hypothetical protein [unclassified Pseudoalteromonas]MDN3377759.1 hypothetical protein [Pseudoalteromonas sp. APC 3893]MDN3385955.1 hypothetical protein [Pseudoalteromonas sp. APC 4017]